jgi:tetratricopeptide (TPR) repeat protein
MIKRCVGMGFFVLTLLAQALLCGSPVRAAQPDAQQTGSPSLQAMNSISGLTVTQNKDGIWVADFDYSYSGDPQLPLLLVELTDLASDARFVTSMARPVQGAHHVTVRIHHPGGENTTSTVTVTMRSSIVANTVFASEEIDKIIKWPSMTTYRVTQGLADKSPQENLKRATALIDAATQVEEAKSILEGLIAANPQFDAAYVELARATLMLNWGPEGLHQAQNLLASALQIRPDSVDAKIVLGYVYAHQERFSEAEAVFADVARSPTDNLWLWAYWGEVLGLQHKCEQAMDKYRVAVRHPQTHGTYDRARDEAYWQLFTFLQWRKDFASVQSLYEQRLSEVGPGTCDSVDYARFKLLHRQDVQGAIDLASSALNEKCELGDARQVIGLAKYVQWSHTEGSQRAQLLNQARSYLPGGPMPLYLLATSDETVPTDKQLIGEGENVDQKDNDQLNALAYALQKRDFDAARRLLSLGARADTPVSFSEIPVALLPVISVDAEAVSSMRRFGVDYSKLRYHGITAYKLAARSGNKGLLDAIKDAGPRFRTGCARPPG